MNSQPQVNIPTILDPKGHDRILLEVQAGLAAEIEWLDLVCGSAQLMQRKEDNGSVTIYPGIYTGEVDYVSAFPSDGLGNFCWFDVLETKYTEKNKTWSSKIGLVVWCNIKQVYPDDWKSRTPENVKDQFLQALKKLRLKKSRFKVLEITSEAKKIYRRYSDRELESQFLMRPYVGFRIDLDFRYTEAEACE